VTRDEVQAGEAVAAFDSHQTDDQLTALVEVDVS
jgi:hypothetical protein